MRAAYFRVGFATVSCTCCTMQATPLCRSFMHLHCGFRAEGMDTPELHHIVVNSWDGGVDAEQNVVLLSIPSVLDPQMAPPGKHTLHAYVPATEPWDLWKGGELRGGRRR